MKGYYKLSSRSDSPLPSPAAVTTSTKHVSPGAIPDPAPVYLSTGAVRVARILQSSSILGKVEELPNGWCMRADKCVIENAGVNGDRQ